MKKIFVVISILLLWTLLLGPTAHAIPGRLWVGSVSAQKASQVEAAMAKLDALFKAYSNSSEPERLLFEIKESSFQLSDAMNSLNEEIIAVIDNLSKTDQEIIEVKLINLYNELLILADKANALFKDVCEIVLVEYKSESLALNYTVIEWRYD